MRNNTQLSTPPTRTATAQAVPGSSARLKSSFPGRILLPLRLFLGVTFLYAGIQKFMDPQFFHPGASGYVGIQLTGFAHGSPLHDFLLNIAVPHAMLFGSMVALGEIAIGLGTLVGLLLRPASFFGLLLSTTFFLTASWHVYPYFFGADIVFMFCWLTLILSGPLFTGYPAFDAWLIRLWALDRPLDRLSIVQQIVCALLGGPVGEVQPDPTAYNEEQQSKGNAKRSRNASRGWRERQQAQMVRRSFMKGTLMGGAGVLSVAVVGWALNIFGGNSGDATTATTATTSSTTAPASTAQSTGGASSSAIAQVNAVPKNSATTFTLPSNGDPGVLIHLSNNQFVAFDATCTHAGCPVSYDASSQHLICPCHGAEYDPAQKAAVIQGPTNTPLSAVSIHVDSATGAITLQ